MSGLPTVFPQSLSENLDPKDRTLLIQTCFLTAWHEIVNGDRVVPVEFGDVFEVSTSTLRIPVAGTTKDDLMWFAGQLPDDAVNSYMRPGDVVVEDGTELYVAEVLSICVSHKGAAVDLPISMMN